MKIDVYRTLASYILPREFNEYFTVVQVKEGICGEELLLHIYLDELDIAPDGRTDLTPNGFYEEARINDFPIRDHRTILHVRRRRWTDSDGKTVSRDWQLVARGTRHSKEFAAFLKEYLGYIPDYSAVTGPAISHKG